MVLPANQDASVLFTLRLRDQVSQGMARVESSFNRVGNAAASTGRFLGQNALAMVSVGTAMVAGANAAAGLLVQMGVLNEEQGKTATKFTQGAGAVVAMVGGLAQLGVFIQGAGGVAGLARLGAAIGAIVPYILPVTVAVGGLTATIAELFLLITKGPEAASQFSTGLLQSIGVPRGAAEFLGGGAGERFGRSRFGQNVKLSSPLFSEGRQNAINVTLNTFAATESELRGAAKTIGRILQEENRVGGFSLP